MSYRIIYQDDKWNPILDAFWNWIIESIEEWADTPLWFRIISQSPYIIGDKFTFEKAMSVVENITKAYSNQDIVKEYKPEDIVKELYQHL